LDLFGIPALLERLEGDPEISKATVCVRRALGRPSTRICALTQMSGGATLYTPPTTRLTEGVRTLETFHPFGSQCYNIFQDLDRVLVGGSSFGPTRPSDTTTSTLAFEWVNRD
jgi:hypothetical protein